jgi:hypothetical protein
MSHGVYPKLSHPVMLVLIDAFSGEPMPSMTENLD